MESRKENAPIEDETPSEEEITMAEFLQEQEKLEKDANVVLGGSDPTNCTYAMGYVARQALYACSTCTSHATETAGICLACSLECHDGHELVELYTKRNFRCDCGNSRLSDTKCKLSPNKSAHNPENRYNHNFRGTYCICDRPYPDPEDTVEDEMIQCVICEDWYHGRHLGSKVPDNDNYDEMICDSCMKKNDFLRFYSVQCKETVTVVKAANSSGPKHVEVEKTSPEKKASMTVSSASVSQGTESVTPGSSLCTNSTATPTPVCGTGSVAAGVKRERNSDVPKPLDSAKPSPKVPTSTENSSSNGTYESKNSVRGDTNAESSNPVNAPCVLGDLRQRNVEGDKLSATFWLAGWRSKLCTCSKCKEMYAEAKIAFLLDDCDPVIVYEAKAPAQECSQYDRGMQALSQLDRVQQVEALHEFNDLQTELKDYLKKFAENGKVVREEDIKEFFTQMSARKRQKATSGGMQYFCK